MEISFRGHRGVCALRASRVQYNNLLTSHTRVMPRALSCIPPTRSGYLSLSLFLSLSLPLPRVLLCTKSRARFARDSRAMCILFMYSGTHRPPIAYGSRSCQPQLSFIVPTIYGSVYRNGGGDTGLSPWPFPSFERFISARSLVYPRRRQRGAPASRPFYIPALARYLRYRTSSAPLYFAS